MQREDPSTTIRPLGLPFYYFSPQAKVKLLQMQPKLCDRFTRKMGRLVV